MLTYSDLVTLLLCFFVLLYSFSTLDVQRFQGVIRSLQDIFGSGFLDGGTGLVDDGAQSGVPMDNTGHFDGVLELLKRDWEQLEEIKAELDQMLVARGWERLISVHREQWGLVLRFQDSVLFELGQADLTPEALQILGEVSAFLSRWPNHVRIEGHADNLPIRNERFPSNWELSTTRATNVLRFLLAETGFDPLKISAVGYGEYRPVAPNDTPDQREKNRRVDIVILRYSLWEMHDFDLDSYWTGEAINSGGDE